MRVFSSRKAHTGVSTTYIPVVKPEMLAEVWASPSTWSRPPTAYSTPRITPLRQALAVSRRVHFSSSTPLITAAMAYRWASTSAGPTWASNSFVNGNDSPQAAATASNANAAIVVCREATGSAGTRPNAARAVRRVVQRAGRSPASSCHDPGPPR